MMIAFPVTLSITLRLAVEAGDRSMARGGRQTWNQQDMAVALAEMARTRGRPEAIK